MDRFAPCPNCSHTHAKPISFTWWGGALGPKMMTHVKCENCDTAYNGKTGELNTNGIIIYNIVVWAIAIAVVYAIWA